MCERAMNMYSAAATGQARGQRICDSVRTTTGVESYENRIGMQCACALVVSVCWGRAKRIRGAGGLGAARR